MHNFLLLLFLLRHVVNPMVSIITVLLALLSAGIQHVLGATSCGSGTPIAFPIADIQVDPSIPDSLMKGIAAKIGTPPQTIVMLPWS